MSMFGNFEAQTQSLLTKNREFAEYIRTGVATQTEVWDALQTTIMKMLETEEDTTRMAGPHTSTTT